MKTKLSGTSLWVLFLVSMILCGCSAKENATTAHARPPVPVSVTTAEARDIPITISSIGRCVSQESVNIVAQVSGEIKEIHVAQGESVNEGDMLYTIDPRKYEATLARLEAELSKAQAQLKLDESQLTRSKPLASDNYISQQQFETYETKVLQSKANIKQIESQIVQAKVDLEHCHITSPIKGMMGKYLIDQGNVVGNMGNNLLTNIQNIWHLYVDFSISENHFYNLNKYFSQKNSLDVEIYGIANRSMTANGKLEFINNFIDFHSGTIHLRATLENKDTKFWPGQSVYVKLRLTILKNAITVPTEAVKVHGNNKYYVFVAKPDNTAELRPISIGETYGDHMVIEKGLALGETVILKGNIMLGNGSQIIVMQQDEQQKQGNL
ncbi:MAG: efflux RND transporter periplasmic adaptor subunit [Puniceicoccales bacterium]|jgi:multidrug efflux system membrane fusion protein|nr:efflux RND transporter periplasmic adaptor subunit [Puniceicoccales bacterium]